MRSIFPIFSGVAVLAVVLAGCNDRPAKTEGPKKPAAHDHPDKGPHGGPLIEWGEEQYHVEFTVDRAKKRATVYILDGNAKKAAPIAAESVTLTLSKPPAGQITLKAEPQDGDPKGQSSRFSGTDEKLAAESELEGEISATVGGTPFSGDFKDRRR
jgi:hypothetical protein